MKDAFNPLRMSHFIPQALDKNLHVVRIFLDPTKVYDMLLTNYGYFKFIV
jgi:hypothetical protein